MVLNQSQCYVLYVVMGFVCWLGVAVEAEQTCNNNACLVKLAQDSLEWVQPGAALSCQKIPASNKQLVCWAMKSFVWKKVNTSSGQTSSLQTAPAATSAPSAQQPALQTQVQPQEKTSGPAFKFQ